MTILAIKAELGHYRLKVLQAIHNREELHRYIMLSNNNVTVQDQKEYTNWCSLVRIYEDKVLEFICRLALAEWRSPVYFSDEPNY